MSDLPKSVMTASMRIAGIEIVVHVLDNGQRVVDQSSAERFFALLADGKIHREDAQKAARFIKGGSHD